MLMCELYFIEGTHNEGSHMIYILLLAMLYLVVTWLATSTNNKGVTLIVYR